MNTPERDDELAALRALKHEVAKLPSEIMPERDLWHGIEQRIRSQPPRQRGRLLELAIAASVAALVSSLVVLSYGRLNGNTAATSPAPLLAYQQVDAAYEPLRKVSLATYKARAENLDPSIRETVEKNLAIIDKALGDIREVLKNRPNDPALNQLLQRTYEQELAVLNAVAPATANHSI